MAYGLKAILGLLSERVGLLKSCVDNHEVIKFGQVMLDRRGADNPFDSLFWPLLGWPRSSGQMSRNMQADHPHVLQVVHVHRR